MQTEGGTYLSGFCFSSKPQNCILYKYSFQGNFAKGYKKRRFGLQNAGKHFLFLAVYAIMTTVLVQETGKCTR